MTSDTDLAHQPDTLQQQSQRSFKPRKPLALIAVALLITLVAGTSGYLLGMRTNQNVSPSTKKVSLQPSPAIMARSSLSTPSPNSTQAIAAMDWQAYINEELGVSFNYPKDWKVKLYPSHNKSEQSTHNVVDLAPSNYRENQYAISLFYYENPESLSIDELNEKLTGNSGIGPRLSTERAKPVKMTNGITAYYQEDNLCEPIICQTYIWSYKGKVFKLINYPPPAPQDRIPNQSQIFDKIFSSLQSN
jgi:hypothetical protein